MNRNVKQAAIELFEEVGLDFTLEQLQARTGVSRTTLYRRIGSKDALLNELLSEGAIELSAQSDIKERIFTATREVVAEYGFKASTMEQIANVANLGVATLYRHFNDKENLLRCFMSHTRPTTSIAPILDYTYGDLEHDLEQVIEIALSFFDENKDLIKILLSWQSSEREYLNEIREGNASTFSLISKYLNEQQAAGVLRTDLSSDDLAMSLLGMSIQYSVLAPTHRERPLDLKRDSKVILKMFLSGAQV